MKRLIFSFVSLLFCTLQLHSQIPDKSVPQQLPKGGAGLTWQVLNINNLWTWHRSDGEGNHSPGGEDGAAYPIFTARFIYEDNLVFGGIMYLNNWPENGGTKAAIQSIRINGGTYLSNHGMIQGWVEGSGAGANYTNSTNHSFARIFRIRRDYTEMSPQELLRDASIVNEQLSAVSATQAMVDAVSDQYAKDWIEWPVQYGAPFIDRNGNGMYDPPPPFSSTFTVDSLIAGGYDEPGIAASSNGIPADQVLYTVYNGLDRTKTLVFSGSEPIGLEIQKTVWGYKSGTELPDHYFVRYRFINKGGVDIGGGTKGSFYIDSLFIGQWSDPDIGNAGDDLYACDTLLHLAYAYNLNEQDNSYQRFALAPPSTGYTILGGPLVPAPSDSGLFGFRRLYGKRNLGMTSFAPEKAGDAWSDPPFEEYERGAGRWWKMLRGFLPLGTMWDSVTYYPHPPGYPNTPFPFAGDPITQTGHIDGLGNPYSPSGGDVRLLATTGPSRLAPGDTAELVVGIAVGLGGDRLSSILIMKQNIAAAREAFEASFEFARAPEKPALTATALNRETILDWGSNAGKVGRTEEAVIARTYRFEGYNVYQLPSLGAPLEQGVKIATFDLKNGVTFIKSAIYYPTTGLSGTAIVQNGTDSGIQHFLSVKRDVLIQYGGPLYNGREYFFAVTAYNYTSDANKRTRTLESEPSHVTVIPQIPFGVQINTRTGDSVSVARVSGGADGSIAALVYDPLKTSGHLYEIRFDTTGSKRAIIHDSSVGADVYSAALSEIGEPLIAQIDGIQLTIVDQPKDFKQFLVTSNAAGPLTPPEIGAFAFNASGFPLLYFDPYTSTDRPNGTRQQSAGLTLSQGWGIHSADTLTGLLYTDFKNIVSSNNALWNQILGNDFEIRFTSAAGQARNGSTGALMNVPFELWNTGSDSASSGDDYRMIPVVYDVNGNGVFDYDGVDHSISGLDNDPETDWISWHDPVDRLPGQAGYSAWVSSGGSNGLGDLVMQNMTLVLWNGGSVSDPAFPSNVSRPLPETGTVFRIITKKPFGPNDILMFTSPAVLSGSSVTKSSARRVGVYPNPYFAGWSYDGQPLQLHVTFNNLPPRVKIRIFNLAGHLVRTLEKNDPSQFLRWDLTNQYNWQIGSGIYICHVEMPDIGETKIIKFAVVLSEAPPTY